MCRASGNLLRGDFPTSSRINVRKRRARGALGHVGGAATDCCGDVCLRVQGFAATWVGLCV